MAHDGRFVEDVAHFLFDVSRYGLVVRTVEAPFFRRVSAWRREAGLDADHADRFHLGPLYRRLSTELIERLGAPRGTSFAQTAGTRDGKGIIFVSHDGDVWPVTYALKKWSPVVEKKVAELVKAAIS